MNRRDALRLALGVPASFASTVVRSQASALRQARSVGILSDLPVTGPDEWAASPFWAPLRSLGWVEGRNLRIERASAERRLERLPGLARKLVDADVDVIFTAGNEAALAAARATRHIPIVFWGVTFPVEMGLVASLARPGGNVTGVALHLDPDEGAKALDFLRELTPKARRLAYLHETMLVHRVDEASTLPPPDNLEEAAGQRGFLVERHPIGESSALGQTLERIA
jgi:putative ABC transport system substrate-binding protein